MTTLIVTYAIAFAAVGGYAAAVNVGTRRVDQRLNRLTANSDVPLPDQTRMHVAA